MYYDERWGDWGLGFAYIAFNIAAVFAFCYFFRLRVWVKAIKELAEMIRKKTGRNTGG